MWEETERPAAGDGGPQMGQCQAASVHIPIIDEEEASCQALLEAGGTVEDILARVADLKARARMCKADGDQIGFVVCRKIEYILEGLAWDWGCRP